MIEIGFGFVTILGALAILMGAGDTLRLPVGDIFPLIGFGGVVAIVAIGLVLIAHGLYRRALVREGANRSELRARGLAGAGLIAITVLSLVVPLVAEPLNLVSIGGFPLGFYMATQGGLLALAALAFASVLRHDAVEHEEGRHDD